MPPEGLVNAAARRSERTLERARRALREIDAAGEPISFQAVARAAGVSRQWLYKQPELRAEIERLRAQAPVVFDGIPARQRATEASLRQRVQMLRVENQRLRDENSALRAELALAYGHRREAEIAPPPDK